MIDNPSFQKFLQEKHILKISQDNKARVELQWDFSGLISNNLNHKHLFLCLSFQKEYIEYFKNLAETAYPLFKCGDLYSIRFIDSKKHSWAEKMKIGKLNYIYKKQEHETERDITIYWSKFFERSLETIEDQRMPTSVCMIVDKNIDYELIEQQIARFRVKTSARTFFFIMSTSFTGTKIDFSKGICLSNIWSIDKKQLHNNYFKIIQSQACRFVELSIVSHDYDICGDNQVWKQINFDFLQRRLYYPLNLTYSDTVEVTIIGGSPKQARISEKEICQYIEKMQTEIKKMEQQGSQRFALSVKYELLDGSTFYSEQEIRLPITNTRKFHSFNGLRKYCKKYTLPWGLQVNNNPLKTIQAMGLSFQRSSYI